MALILMFCQDERNNLFDTSMSNEPDHIDTLARDLAIKERIATESKVRSIVPDGLTAVHV